MIPCQTSHAQTRAQGPTSKSTRVEPVAAEGGPVHFNLNFLPWRKQSAARQTIESTFSRADPQLAPAPVARGASYLPTAGSIPLRFGSARTWPERMAPAQEAALSIALSPDPDLAIRRDELLAQQAAGVPVTPPVVAPETAAETITASSAAAAESREPQIVQRPLLIGAGEAILTADLVLRSLANIPSERGSVPGEFRPAVPEAHVLESVPLATAQ